MELHIAVDGSLGVRITIAVRIAQELTVLAEEGEVATPGVDTDGLDLDAFFHAQAQGVDNLVVEGRKVPEEMSSKRNHRVLESCEFVHFNLLAVESGDNRPSGGGSKVYCKIVFVYHR